MYPCIVIRALLRIAASSIRGALALTILALCAISSLTPNCTAQELIFEEASDVLVSPIPSLTGFIVVSLQTSSGDAEVRIIDLANGRALKPTRIDFPTFDVSTSPNEEGMIVSRATSAGGELFWTLLDGSLPMQISKPSIKKYEVTWGKRSGDFVYVGEFSSSSKELFGISSSANPSQYQITTYGGRNTTPHVNPISGVIAYSTSRRFPGWDVCLYDPATSRGTCPLGNTTESFCRPKWSPDGTRLVYSRGQDTSIDLYTYTLSTALSKRITTLPYKEYDGAWSPDGDFIVFSHEPKGDDIYGLKILRVRDGSVYPLASSTRSLRGATWTNAASYQIATPSPTPTQSPSPTPTSTLTPTLTATPSPTATETATEVPSVSPTSISTATATASPIDSPTEVPTSTPSGTNTPQGTPDTASPTPSPSQTTTLPPPTPTSRYEVLTRPPQVYAHQISRTRARVTVRLKGPTATGIVRIQINNQIKTLTVISRTHRMLTTHAAKVRASFRPEGYARFSPWSEWIEVKINR